MRLDDTGRDAIYLARTADGDQVTVTLVDADWPADGAERDRFTAEARSARQVAPFCAARMLDAGFDDGRPYLVTEYVGGPTLREAVTADGPRNGAVLQAIAIGAATGIAAIHQAGLVHGQFGPDHLVLGGSGPRVVNFAITPPYGSATPAADMLSWARTVVFAAAGRRTVGTQDLAFLPEPLRSAAAGCLAPDPRGRPTARAALTQLLGHSDPPAGLLAEGSRRAADAAVRSRRQGARPHRAAEHRAAEHHTAEHRAHKAPDEARPEGRDERQDEQRPPRPRQRYERARWPVGVAIVAAVAATVATLLVTRGGSSGADVGHTSHQVAGVSTDPSPSRPVTLPSATLPVPQVFGGTWTGRVRQGSPPLDTAVQITLTAGSTVGKISYPDLGCTGDLVPVTSDGRGLVLRQGIVTGLQACEGGLVTLSKRSDGNLTFSFRATAAGLGPSGILTRQ